MTRLLIALPLVLSAASWFPGLVMAEGPGTRIRSSSDLPRLLESLPRDPANPCARLQGAARQRCLDEERKPVETGRRSGPESTGMGSAGGSSASSGSSGAASIGAGAPR
jgi:hypothetical protein